MEAKFTILYVDKINKISKHSNLDYDSAMEKYNKLISSNNYLMIKLLDSNKEIVEQWDEGDGKDIQVPQNNLKTTQENIPMSDEKTPVVKKRGRKPKLGKEEEEKQKEITQSILQDYKKQMERTPLPPYLEKEIAEHKENCECDLCQVAKVAFDCRQEDIKELEKEIPELVSDTPPVSPVSPKTREISTQTDDIECITCSTSKRRGEDPDYWKKYYQANKEKLKEQKKKWREANKDKVNSEKKKEYQKNYDLKNKEKIKERRERLIVCECGEEMKSFSLRKHKTSKIHKLKVELKIARGQTIVETPIDDEDDTSSISSNSSS
jgi:glucosamine 6-phosphate synthetase-like amidotransferase/phosphosugar isomerase protein